MNSRGNEKRKQILQFIQLCLEQDGYPPSVREIGEGVGLSSPSSVHQHLKRLEQDGYIVFDEKHKKRALRLAKDAPGLQPRGSVPLLVRASAGDQPLAPEEVEDYIPFKPAMGTTDDLFALRVRGESMIGAGIMDGDIVIIKRGNHARNGDIVVAIAGDEEASIKRFFREDGRFRLQPENSAMEPVFVNMHKLKILGRVTALIRHLQ